MIKVMWISGFFYGASVLSKSVAELAFSFADVLLLMLLHLLHWIMSWAPDHVNEIGR